MGRDAHDASPAARAVFEAADRALGFPLSKLCFEGPEDELRRTENQQPAILTTSIALLRALGERMSVTPSFVAGHSLGEYTALVAAGALALEDAVRLVHARGRFMQEAVPEGQGAMAAILGGNAEMVADACFETAEKTGQVVVPANWNSPQQTVIAGHTAAVGQAGELARQRGAKRAIALPVSAPFHCSLMEPAADKLAAELAQVRFSDPMMPVVTNVEAKPNAEGARIPELLRRQVTAAVRFTETVQRLASLGIDRVLEVGPGHVLSGLVARIDRKIQRSNASGIQEINELAATAAAG
ncbi:MAG: ACP S-malonyltransferase [bacterium]|nr:ACP S-malonyltransferase [bacterium]MCP5065183.1 ACP S-malonyltransferase [bacterium]